MNRPAAVLGVVLVAVVGFAGCGRKTATRPPEDVCPRAIDDLKIELPPAAGVKLSWKRPRTYVDGARLRDLGRFEVWRALPGSPFELTATIPVDDRDRFQQVKSFQHVDNTATSGDLYRYYVLSFTIDGYSSDRSNIVAVPTTDTSVK